ncbi:ABC transporter ATP-binding protein [Methylocystis sp. 9N]|uniref:ABC transporter ATP-binding protein n=1 Tax=Methylocystis borbori TaxID=3118750 RepID=A0ABU7XEC3_9HYPH
MSVESDIAIEVRGLTKSFGARKVVDNFSLQVERGHIQGFLGPNGSGKTTTIRMLCGLLTPDAGEGRCLGYDIRTQQEEIKRHVGYMTQGFSLYRDLTIRENLEFVARIYGLEGPERAAQDALERLGLLARADQLAGELSGGWKQRLALCACTLPGPSLLLLDEPTAGVDPKARRDFWDEIHHLATQGLTVLVSTHYMDEAERCHEIAYIANGRLLASGTIPQIIAGAGLSTWVVTGEGLDALAREIQKEPGVDMVARFGGALHVGGRDGAAMERLARRYGANAAYRWARDEPTLEDVFIDLMIRSGADK